MVVTDFDIFLPQRPLEQVQDRLEQSWENLCIHQMEMLAGRWETDLAGF